MKKRFILFVTILILMCSFIYPSGAKEVQIQDENIIIESLEGSTRYVQLDILRIHPDDSAPFVTMRVLHSSQEPNVDVLFVYEEWEKVRLHYHFIYNDSRDPSQCARSLFNQEFIGYRRVLSEK